MVCTIKTCITQIGRVHTSVLRTRVYCNRVECLPFANSCYYIKLWNNVVIVLKLIKNYVWKVLVIKFFRKIENC